MELLDIYTQDRSLTGKQIERGYNLEKGEYHLVVHVCLFNSNGEMLIQQRQPFKKGWPNRWDLSVGGCATAGDTSQTAAEREVLEEIGYHLDLSHTRPALTLNFDRGFDDIYLIVSDLELDTLILQYEEVQQVKWASLDEILKLIELGAFIPYHSSLIQLLFDMRHYSGAHYKKI